MRHLSFLFIFLLLVGCSEDDSNEQELEIGGVVYRSQIVTIPNSGSDNEEYSATFGEDAIIVYKLSEEELFFMVPPNMNIETKILTIPSLGNRRIEYEVSETVLEQNVDETLSPLLTSMNTFKTEIENDDSNSPQVQNAISILDRFEQELNQASNEDKQIFAEFYFVNKPFIDEIYGTDYTTALARNYSNLTDTEAFFNLGKAISKAVASSLSAFVLIEVPFANFIAAAIAVKAWYDAWDLFYDVKSRNIFTVDFFINDIPSSLSGNSDQIIIYSHNLSREDIIVYEGKPLDESQSDSNIESIKKFFSARRLMNNAINKLNNVIEFVNNNLSTNFSSFDTFILDESQIQVLEMSDEVFNSLNFDVADDNVDINEISFQNNTITTKFSIIDQNMVDGDYIDTSLNFTFQDNFNNIQGSYPIRINKENEIDLSGTWIMNTENTSCSSDEVGVPPTIVGFTFNTDNTTVSYSGFTSTYLLIDNQLSFDLTVTSDPYTEACDNGNTSTYTEVNTISFSGIFENDEFSGNANFLYEIENISGDPCFTDSSCSATATLYK
ncbi:hypothetical protein [Psychroserpens algicola]|uniref:hypothetical protein n=1 Tax=Psychroserpens algicola TaxID=1719034 RepID=UPI001954B332|nr:hypothetical protein [Psychroserpens algicola]